MTSEQIPRGELEAAAARRMARQRRSPPRPAPCLCRRCRPDLHELDTFTSAPDEAFVQAELPVDSMGAP